MPSSSTSTTWSLSWPVIERPVVNASPLIFLSRADRLGLLQLLNNEIVVPETVATEILHRGSADPTAKAVSKLDWLVVEPSPPIPEAIQGWDLGAGESSVLAWGMAHPGADLFSTISPHGVVLAPWGCQFVAH